MMSPAPANNPRTPGEAKRTNHLDFNNSEDFKYQKPMIKPFDTKFNGKGEKVKLYIEHISEYASSGGMMVLFTIADPITGAPQEFLKQYGAIPMIDLRIHINGIYNGTGCTG
jgi:hypothetical protein